MIFSDGNVYTYRVLLLTVLGTLGGILLLISFIIACTHYIRYACRYWCGCCKNYKHQQHPICGPRDTTVIINPNTHISTPYSSTILNESTETTDEQPPSYASVINSESDNFLLYQNHLTQSDITNAGFSLYHPRYMSKVFPRQPYDHTTRSYCVSSRSRLNQYSRHSSNQPGSFRKHIAHNGTLILNDVVSLPRGDVYNMYGSRQSAESVSINGSTSVNYITPRYMYGSCQSVDIQTCSYNNYANN